MSTKTREIIWGGRIMGADIHIRAWRDRVRYDSGNYPINLADAVVRDCARRIFIEYGYYRHASNALSANLQQTDVLANFFDIERRRFRV